MLAAPLGLVWSLAFAPGLSPASASEATTSAATTSAAAERSGAPDTGDAAGETETPPSEVPASRGEPDVPPPSPDPAPTWARRAPRWAACTSHAPTCTRSRPARLTLGLAGLVGAALGGGALLIVGDRLRAGDPGAMMMAMGTVAMGGVAIGALAALGSGDAAGNPDRIRPSTVGLDGSFDGTNTLGESRPGTLGASVAPTWYFPDGGGRLRILARGGGRLGPRVDVDPRETMGGSFPEALVERSWYVDAGADLAVGLPYPAGRGRARLGPWNLRWRPTAHIRRERIESIDDVPGREYERVMLLPLTVGAQWQLSPRQRFTFYAGPRFDFLAYRLEDEKKFHRGPGQRGAIYGEAWYDIDFPDLLSPKAAVRFDLQGQLSFGYVHSRFDGRGVNLGGAVGFLGPANAAWRMKLRRRGSPVAAQLSLGAWVGNGVGTFAQLGVALPDLGRDPSRSRAPTAAPTTAGTPPASVPSSGSGRSQGTLP